VVPYKADLLGIPSLSDHIKHWEVVFHNDYFQKDGFDSSGRIHYYNKNGGAAAAQGHPGTYWGDDGLMVFDRIFAEKDYKGRGAYLSPLYLVNDFWTKNRIDFAAAPCANRLPRPRKSSAKSVVPRFGPASKTALLFQFVWGRDQRPYLFTAGKTQRPTLLEKLPPRSICWRSGWRSNTALQRERRLFRWVFTWRRKRPASVQMRG